MSTGAISTDVTSGIASSSDYHHHQASSVSIYGVDIVCLTINGQQRLCLAQISNTLLKDYSYNEIHNRRVALGITCVQCTPVQLEVLRRRGAMPVTSRRCGMITKREAERLVKSFLEETNPPKLATNFRFDVMHECGWGCRGQFVPSRYNSSRAKCVQCSYCRLFFSPNKFIFHSHQLPSATYRHPDAANFNSWRRHLLLENADDDSEQLHAWEDVKAMFNGGSKRRLLPVTPTRHFVRAPVGGYSATPQHQNLMLGCNHISDSPRFLAGKEAASVLKPIAYRPTPQQLPFHQMQQQPYWMKLPASALFPQPRNANEYTFTQPSSLLNEFLRVPKSSADFAATTTAVNFNLYKNSMTSPANVEEKHAVDGPVKQTGRIFRPYALDD